MLSRRYLRIKILQILYAYFKVEDKDLAQAENELVFSIKKSYELYHFLLLLIVEIRDYALERIEIAKNKKIPTHEDLHPNTKFVDNRFIHQLEENQEFKRYIQKSGSGWTPYRGLIKKLYNDLVDSDYYKAHMEDGNRDYQDDKQLVLNIYRTLIPGSAELYDVLEEQSIYWNDEVPFVIRMVYKTLRVINEKQGDEAALVQFCKDDEDLNFAKLLLRKTALHAPEHKQYIKQTVKNWEMGRIAFLDMLIMYMAITEVIGFPSIPYKVTLNEYIEISKMYSTNKSSIFINGILDKVFHTLKAQNKIHKNGRGMIGEC